MKENIDFVFGRSAGCEHVLRNVEYYNACRWSASVSECRQRHAVIARWWHGNVTSLLRDVYQRFATLQTSLRHHWVG